jgi:long-chain acyl-CoA synthetase
VLVYSPPRNTLGFSRASPTAGGAIGPDCSFYRSIGINMKQLYGSTGTADVRLPADNQARADTVGVPTGCRSNWPTTAIPRQVPAPAQEYYKTGRHGRLLTDGWYHTTPASSTQRPPENHRPREGRGPPAG